MDRSSLALDCMRISRGMAAALGVAIACSASSSAAAVPVTWGGAPEVPAEQPADAPAQPFKREEAQDAARSAAGETASPSTSALDLPLEIEQIQVTGNSRTASRVVTTALGLLPGSRIAPGSAEWSRLQLSLLKLGFFEAVTFALKRGSVRPKVVLEVAVIERRTLTLQDAWLGLAKSVNGNGRAAPLAAYGGLDIAEHNIDGSGVGASAAIGVAEGQLALRARLQAPRLFSATHGIFAELLYNRARDVFGRQQVEVGEQRGEDLFALVRYTRIGATLGATLPLGNSRWRAAFSYRFEVIDAETPPAASEQQGTARVPIEFGVIAGESRLSMLRATLSYSTRDAPVLPTTGHDLALDFSASPLFLGSSYGFVRAKGQVQAFYPALADHVLALGATATAIVGDAPLFEQVYVGDLSDFLPRRMLDLAVDRRGAPNLLGTSVAANRYGQLAAKIGAEYRIPVYRGTRSVLAVDSVFSAGAYALAGANTLDGSNLRGRQITEKFPIDICANAGLRIDTSAGAAYIGVSTWLALLPFLGTTR